MNNNITSEPNKSLPKIIKKNNMDGTASFSNLLNETSKVCNMTEKNLKATFGKLLYENGYRLVKGYSHDFCINHHDFLLFCKDLVDKKELMNAYVNFCIEEISYTDGFTHIKLFSEADIHIVNKFISFMLDDYYTKSFFHCSSHSFYLAVPSKKMHTFIFQELTKDYLQIWYNQNFFKPFNDGEEILFEDNSPYIDANFSKKNSVNLNPFYKELLISYLENTKLYRSPTLASKAQIETIIIDRVCINPPSISNTNYDLYYFISIYKNTTNRLTSSFLDLIITPHNSIALAQTVIESLKEVLVPKKVLITGKYPINDIINTNFTHVPKLLPVLIEPFYTLYKDALNFDEFKRYLKSSPNASDNHIYRCLLDIVAYDFHAFTLELKTACSTKTDFDIFLNNWVEHLNAIIINLRTLKQFLNESKTRIFEKVNTQSEITLNNLRLISLANASANNVDLICTNDIDEINIILPHGNKKSSTTTYTKRDFFNFLISARSASNTIIKTNNELIYPPSLTQYKNTIKKVLSTTSTDDISNIKCLLIEALKKVNNPAQPEQG